jgi:NADPH-dependent 2,4-dienoyl-CoA reductase/sulfur reductase-like enzyme
MSRSVLVIGGGPGGLAAAYAALDRGAEVTLLDGSDQLGGQYWRHAPGVESPDLRLQHGWNTFTRLRDALLGDPRCTVLTSAHVWAVEPNRNGAAGPPATVHVLVGPADGTNRDARTFRPDTLVLATGAHDRTLPFPGWDLPGVYTAGAAQAFAKAEGIALGRRVVVAGAGPFLLPVAASLTAIGARVLGVFEASPIRRLAAGWLPRPWQLLGSVTKAGELGGYVAHQVRARVPYRTGHAVVAAHGDHAVEAVTIARVDSRWSPLPGSERRLEADAVCVSHAFTPRLELPIAAGGRVGTDGFLVVDDDQRCAPGVYAAGEITGIAGADAAMAEGSIAGHCAAGGSATDAAIRVSVRDRTRSSQFARRLAAAHGIGSGWRDWLTEPTLVCRCEEVSYGRLCQVSAATPDAGLRSLRLSTRAGLGACQGRICGRTVAELLGRPGSTDHRPIATPIRLGELAQDQPPINRTTRTEGHRS